jgi:MoaA/NifB/PqqE/SkfB family radical SAM enzyme
MTEERVKYRSPSYYEISNPAGSTWRGHRSPEYHEYRRLWAERPVQRDPGDFPLHVDIDPTNACNLKCVMCPRTHFVASGNQKWSPEGRIGYMDPALFEKVVDQAADGGAFSIKLNYLGEPILHPRLPDMIAAAKRRGLEVMMNTNAVLLTADMSRRLLDAGVDDVFFSVDSPYPEQYERIRKGARFEQVIRHIGQFIELQQEMNRPEVQTRVSMVVLDPDDRKARDDFKDLFRGLGVAEIGFGLATDMNLDYYQRYGPIPDFVCPDLYLRLFVYWDGQIGPCCGQWERGCVLGDANRDDLAEVWRNPEYQAMRRAHETGRYDRVSICRACSVPWLSSQEVP